MNLDKYKAMKISVLTFVFIAAIAITYTLSSNALISRNPSKLSTMVPASITDVYPLFMCPCCGQPLDPEKICCGLAKERIDYISALSDSGISNDEIVFLSAKKYGVETVLNESLREEIKLEIARRAPKDRPKITVEPDYYDFGEVRVAQGVVNTEMTVSNKGTRDLVLDNMETSCMCTTSTLTVGGSVSPVFGMNMNDGTHPTGWNATIPPGETAFLTVSYDPEMHSDLRGPITRTITLYSNDPVDFKKEVRIEAVQVD